MKKVLLGLVTALCAALLCLAFAGCDKKAESVAGKVYVYESAYDNDVLITDEWEDLTDFSIRFYDGGYYQIPDPEDSNSGLGTYVQNGNKVSLFEHDDPDALIEAIVNGDKITVIFEDGLEDYTLKITCKLSGRVEVENVAGNTYFEISDFSSFAAFKFSDDGTFQFVIDDDTPFMSGTYKQDGGKVTITIPSDDNELITSDINIIASVDGDYLIVNMNYSGDSSQSVGNPMALLKKAAN